MREVHALPVASRAPLASPKRALPANLLPLVLVVGLVDPLPRGIPRVRALALAHTLAQEEPPHALLRPLGDRT